MSALTPAACRSRSSRSALLELTDLDPHRAVAFLVTAYAGVSEPVISGTATAAAAAIAATAAPRADATTVRLPCFPRDEFDFELHQQLLLESHVRFLP